MLELYLATAGLGCRRDGRNVRRLIPYDPRFFRYRSFDGNGLPASAKPCFSKSGIVPVKTNAPGISWFPGFVGFTG